MSASVNEKQCILNMVFLRGLREKHQSKLLILNRKYISTEEFVYARIDGGVQPESI